MADEVRRGGRVLTSALLVAVAAACGEGDASELPARLVASVERLDLMITAEATGTIEPIRKVEVKSKASGEILQLFVDIGDQVEPGALLAQIDPRDVQNAYNQAVADHDVAKARLEIAESQRSRSENLLDAGVITEQEHEGKNLEFANARAALVKAETSLGLARLQLGDVTIRAPLGGTVLQKNVEVGQVIASASGNVSGGTILLMMASLDEMQVRTLVDETDVGRIQAGMAASVRVEAFPDRMFEGFVEKIEPQAVVQQNVTMFPVIVRLDNRDGFMKPGMSAEVAVMIAERLQTLTLPNNVIVSFQEMAPAAMVLGMDPEGIQMDRSVFQDLTRQLAANRAAERGEAVPTAPAGQGAAGGLDMDALRARVTSGEISQDSVRALVAAMRQGGGAAGARPGGAAGGRPGGANARRGAAVGDPSAGRPAIVFVEGADEKLEARAILLGVNDWDRTEVLIGLEEGERIAVVGAAQLQARQQERVQQILARQGSGPFPGVR